MIEMISIANWVYLKQQLIKYHHDYLLAGDCGETRSFKNFVEEVFSRILKWNQFFVDVGITLDMINNDDELALDIIEALGLDSNEEIRSDCHIHVLYIDSLGAVIVEACPKAANAADEATYQRGIEELRLTKLTILARLLDVLRQSKIRK